ncbi:CRTAC1 family protein, partial [Steroidobacter sp.]|uniref:CRTAC1 family protein n=1 Tax=Steroidobacter sp. TaxID=1978227 RepID=UPI001A3E6C60
KWARNFSRPTVGDAALMAQVGTLGKLKDGSVINYGLGVSREAFAGHEGLIHLGSDAAYRAVFCYFPATDFGVFILGNTPFDQRRAVESITDIYLNDGTGRAPEIATPVVAIDRAKLASAVGSYLSPYGKMISLTRNNGELQWQVTGESPKTAIFRADGTFDFGSRVLGAYRLRSDSKGKVVAIEEWPGWPRPIPTRQLDAAGNVRMVADFAAKDARGTTLHQRIEPSHPSAAALHDLAGSYRSRELDAIYQISAEQDRLIVRSLWLGEPIVFTPTAADRFDSGHSVLSTIQFVRDAGGEPVAFKVQGRVRDLVFERESGPPPQFSVHQSEVFSAPGALANAWADFDNDGDLDLAVSFKSGEVRLYRNDGGNFSNVGAALGLPTQGDEARGLSWGDYDGDGFVDLYVGMRKVPIASRNLLYRNEGGKRFVEVAEAAGVAMPGVSSRQSNWIDYDNDGDLDLFVANRIGENGLFRNDGGKFVNVAKALGVADVRRSVGACWFDMDQDGDLDLFLANQEGDKDAFYRNDGTRFTDVAPELGMDQPHRRLAEGGVGCAVGDYDNDGDLDLFVASYGFNLLYRNDGGGRFVEVAKSLGITEPGLAVGASWGDYDLDGLLDLYIAGYVRGANGLEPKDLLLRNTGHGFVDVVPAADVLNHADHGVQWADFDADGDLDLSLTDSRDAGRHWVLKNDAASKDSPRSLQVTVLDRQGHHTRAGAEVRLFDSAGKLLGTRLVTTGEGYDSQSVQPVHFGLARTERVTVEVTFLGKDGRTRQHVRNVDPAKFLGSSVVVRQN